MFSIRLKLAISLMEPGAPALPYVLISVLVPANGEFQSITVSNENSTVIKKDFNPMPFQGLYQNGDTYKFVDPDPAVYAKNKVYPYENNIVYKGSKEIRGFNLLTFAVNLFKVNPVKKELFFTSALDYTITYTLDKNMSYIEPHDYFESMVSDMVENPEDLDTFYPKQPTARSMYSSRTTYDMLFITNNALKSAFTTYAEYRKNITGKSYKVVTVEEIYANSAYNGEKHDYLMIKRCVQDYYKNYNTMYLIIGGDIDIVPVPRTYANAPNVDDGLMDNTIPTDMFYVALSDCCSFDWNGNNDDKVGEKGVDSVDIGPDMMVGRMPFSTAAEVNTYINKMNRYLSDIQTNPGFIKRTLLIGTELFNSGDSQARLERIFSEAVSPLWSDVVKMTNYQNAPEIQDTTSVINSFNENSNLVLHSGHGASSRIRLESGKLYTTDISSLTNTPGVFASIACDFNRFDNVDDSIGETLIKHKDGGALVSLASSRKGIIEHNPLNNINSSFSYMLNFTKELLKDSSMPSMSAGDAYYRMMNYVGNVALYNDNYRWLQYNFTYLGDPTFIFYKQSDVGTYYPEHMNSGDYTISDIAVTQNGDKYFIGKNGWGTHTYKWVNDSWSRYSELMIKVDTAADGSVWFLRNNGDIFHDKGNERVIYGGMGISNISVGQNAYAIEKSGESLIKQGSSWVRSNIPFTDVEEIEEVKVNTYDLFVIRGVDRTLYGRQPDGTWDNITSNVDDMGGNGRNWLYFTRYDRVYRFNGIKTEFMRDYNGKYIDAGPDGLPFCARETGTWQYDDPITYTELTANILGKGISSESNWRLYTFGNAIANLVHSYQDVRLHVTEGSTANWHAILVHENVSLVRSKYYEVTFEASCPTLANGSTKRIEVMLAKNSDPWTEYGSKFFDLTNETKKYTFRFNMSHNDDSKAIIQFCLGQTDNIDFIIDNVSVRED